MINIKNLTKIFSPDVIAVNNLTINVKQGVNGLVGENGAGKSTLMRLIADVYDIDQGQILIDGVSHTDKEAKNNLFYLSDSPYFNKNSTAYETAVLYSSLFEMDLDKYTSLFNKLSLPLNRKISTFSKGMRRQMFLCIALSMKAKYLLLDEAFDGLDPLIQEIVKEEINILAKEKTIVLSSHNLASLQGLCNNFIILSKGKFKKEGSAQDLGKQYTKYQILFNTSVREEDLKNIGVNVISFKQIGSIVHIVIDSESDAEIIKEKYNPQIIEKISLENDEIIALQILLSKKGDNE